MIIKDIIRSPRKNKKYRAYLEDQYGKSYVIDFGDIRYQQYQDSTDLKFYSHLDHKDDKRRQAYHNRHKNNNGLASQLSKAFLW